MPLGTLLAPLAAPLIAGGASLLGGGLNAVSTAQENARSREFAYMMYQRQFADNIGLWNMQNAYNSPSAQMERYRDAGLNPRLIYGQANTAGGLQAPSAHSPNFTPPRWGDMVSGGAMSLLDQMYNMEMKSAQVDIARAQHDVLVQEAMQKVANIADTRATTQRRMFDLDFESELRSTSADARKAMLRQLQTNIDLSVRKDIREQIQSATSVNEAVDRMRTAAEHRLTQRIQRAKTAEEMRTLKVDRERILQQIGLLKKEGIIKRLDADLAKQNIRPGDPLWSRWMVQGFDSVWNFLFK